MGCGPHACTCPLSSSLFHGQTPLTIETTMPNVINAEESVDLNEIERIIETMPEWATFSSLGNDDVAPRENMNDANGSLTGQAHSMDLAQHNGLPSHTMQSHFCEPDGNLTFEPCSDSAPFSNVNDFQDVTKIKL